MTTNRIHSWNGRYSPILFIISILYVFFSSMACNTKNEAGNVNADEPGLIHASSSAMNIDMSDSAHSGWNTIIYKNESPETHFLLFEKYPAGKNIDSARARVVSVFQEAMDSIQVGHLDAGLQTFSKLPAWFSEVQYLGGTGLIAPGKTAQTTLHLTPGLYVIECYVKMPNGKFHSAMGMLDQLIVKEENSNIMPPADGIAVSVSSDSGIVLHNAVVEGKQVFKVNFKDQKQQENFVGMDVHLVRLDEQADIGRLEAWMNWMDPNGLISPAPAGVEFLGGTQELPAGDSAYFTVDISPGKYVLIAEVPNASKKNLLKTFSVP